MKGLLAEMEHINPEACYSLWRCVEKLLSVDSAGNDAEDGIF